MEILDVLRMKEWRALIAGLVGIVVGGAIGWLLTPLLLGDPAFLVVDMVRCVVVPTAAWVGSLLGFLIGRATANKQEKSDIPSSVFDTAHERFNPSRCQAGSAEQRVGPSRESIREDGGHDATVAGC
jgi:hypothetical protein